MPPAETADLELIQFRCLKLYSFVNCKLKLNIFLINKYYQ